jgi:ribonuclease HI
VTDYSIIFDGGSKGNGTANAYGYGSFKITTRTGKSHQDSLVFGRHVTNNEAEYRALIAALTELIGRIERAGRDPKDFTVEIRGDSQLVINQVKGDWECKADNLRQLLSQARNLVGRFNECDLDWHSRENSVEALGH